MAIGATVRTSGSSTANATTYATASISPTAGRVLLAVVFMSGIGTATASTITGLSGTWTNRTGSNRPAALATYDLAVFTCTNYTGSGTLTLGNTDAATSACWSIIELTGANTTTPIVVSALKKVSLGSVSTGTVTLDAPGNASNRPFVAFGCNNNTAAQAAPRASWLELTDVAVNTPGTALQVQWRNDTYETTGSVTYTGGPYTAAAVAVEVQAQGGATVTGVAVATLGGLTGTALSRRDVSGTGSAAIGVTGTAVGLRQVPGVVSLDLGAFTADATAVVKVTGTAVAALGGLTAAAVAAVAVFGVAPATLGGLISTAAGGQLIGGAAVANLGSFTATATSVVSVAGVAVANLGPATVTALGGLLQSGAAEAVLGDLAATVTAAPVVVGVGGAQLGSLLATAEGFTTVVGASVATLGGLTGTASGSVDLFGTAEANLGTLHAVIATIPVGAGGSDLGGLTADAVGLREVLALADASQGAFTATAASSRDVSGTASIDMGSLTADAVGLGTGPQNYLLAELGGLSASITGLCGVDGVGLAAIGATISAIGAPTRPGIAESVLGDLVATATGHRTLTAASAGADLDGLLAVALGGVIEAQAGSASVDLGALVATAIGFESTAGHASVVIGFTGIAVAFVHPGFPELGAGRPTLGGTSGGQPGMSAYHAGGPTVVSGGAGAPVAGYPSVVAGGPNAVSAAAATAAAAEAAQHAGGPSAITGPQVNAPVPV